ncbi:hypothetical protein [Novosphingobium sp. JCM 18896]|uniref:hypothetical protein n=1 Tax=Novosphingobium sp. JCM 18896 TaxID=2989731 RepID=UPI002222CEC6|nr:hypothetical protein [Novosphingobium sp. JCM 18896]MCW1432059.1 hypothetical protein [Novosphingobium sp. JCM 18896]
MDTAEPSFASLQREVSLLQAEYLGVQSHVGQFGSSPGYFSLSRRRKREILDMLEGSSDPCLLVDPRPGLRIVDANHAMEAATFTRRSAIAGDKLFAALPGGREGDDVITAFEAYKICAQTLRRHTLPAQRYDIEGAGGEVLLRHWRSQYFPITDDAGSLIYLLNRAVPLIMDQPTNFHRDGMPDAEACAPAYR